MSINQTAQVSSGKSILVYVVESLGDPDDWPPFFCIPPSTSTLQPVAAIDRGENFYGSLDEEFYVASNVHDEPEYFVLWLADSGSQNDDNKPRLFPVAWCDHIYSPTEETLSEKDAAEAMLSVWISTTVATFGEYSTEDEVGDDMLLPRNLVEMLIKRAVNN